MPLGIAAAILCHVTQWNSQEHDRKAKDKICVTARCFCENVGLFSEYFRLDKKSVLEGRDGAYVGRLAVFREDNFRQCYRGKRFL